MQVKIREKGQMTLPKEVREQIGVSAGESLTVLVVDGEIRMRPTKGVVERLFGSMKKYIDPDAPNRTIEETIALEKEAAAMGWTEREARWQNNQ
jgi:AbrB family looped-hinge helix DNA binding protein